MKCLKHHAQRLATGLLLGICALNVHFAHAATNCNQVTQIPVSECQSLLELYNSTNGANWTDNWGWNETNTPCSWKGVKCDEGYKGHIQYLYLDKNQLSGSIPNFSNLPNLIAIDFSSNQLSESIPNFTNLPNLMGLHLEKNQLSGSIPNFANLPKLTSLDLSSNQLSGSIPNFSNLPNLVALGLESNQLSGSIPNFNNLPNLQYLHLFSNQLSGNIPNFSNLPNLVGFGLNSNQLTGSIPNFTSFHLANLKYAFFYKNCGLTAYDAAQETVLSEKDPLWYLKEKIPIVLQWIQILY